MSKDGHNFINAEFHNLYSSRKDLKGAKLKTISTGQVYVMTYAFRGMTSLQSTAVATSGAK
jgi:hypothetical protein